MPYHSNPALDGLDITNYWQYFHLHCDPFTMHADESLIYLPGYWEEMLDLIQYITHYKNQLVVITGSNGIGKTVLADLFETQLGESVHCVKIAAEQSTSVMRLLEFLSDAFLVPWQPEASIEQLLDDQLHAFQHKEKNCLLLIDNAQLLPIESLEALLYFVAQQSDSQMRFHIALFGESTVRQTLQRMLDPTEEALVHFLTIEPLSLEETEQYLNYRLSAANWQDANPMSEEVVARIYRLSEGNPARINRIARRFLLDLLIEQESDQKKSWLRKYVTQLIGAGLLVVMLIVLAVWIWHSNIIQHVKLAKIQSVKPTVTVNGEVLPAPIKYIDQAALHPSLTPPVAAVAPTPPAEIVVAQPAKAVSPVSIAGQKSNVENNQSPAIVAAEPVQAQATPVNASAKPEASIAAKTETSSTPSRSELSAPVSQTAQTPVVSQAVSGKTSDVVSRVPTSKKATKEKATQDSGSYTIQLLHLQYDGTLAQFIKKNHLTGKIRVVSHTVQGKKITEITYGSYQTMHDAEQAVATLPSSLMSAAPWPKKK
jgi:type II secretory pathway predicted ATPase ExeA/septal ring-binding cell division protein DamX